MGLWGQATSPETAEAVLRRRLDALGMPPFSGFATHTNRTVLLSVTAEGVLRLHRGYAWAPDRVLSARAIAERRVIDSAEHHSGADECLSHLVRSDGPTLGAASG